MKILVTGSEGFIGTNLCPLLIENNHEPVPFDIKNDPYQDCTWLNHFHEYADGCDAIVHLAARAGVPDSIAHPNKTFTQNVWSVQNGLMAALRLRIPRFVFASSGAAAHPLHPYGAHKACGEALCRGFHSAYGLETVCLRFSNVYGPHSTHKNSVVAEFCKAAVKDLPITIFGSGEQQRDFVYVGDICAGILNALEAPAEDAAGQTFALASGQMRSLIMLAYTLSDIQGKNPLRIINREERPGDILIPPAVDLTSARTKLGYEPRMDFFYGVEKTLEWFISQEENY